MINHLRTTHHSADKNHPKAHWHGASPKIDPATGKPIVSKYNQIKYQKSGSSSVMYDDKTEN